MKSRCRTEKYPDKLERYSRKKKYSGIEKGHVQGCVLMQTEDDKGWSKYEFGGGRGGGGDATLQCLVIYVSKFKCYVTGNPKSIGAWQC